MRYPFRQRSLSTEHRPLYAGIEVNTMGKYNHGIRCIEMDASDEAVMPAHFKNARKAWAARQDVMDGRMVYHVDDKGVWARIQDWQKPEYFWPKALFG